MPRVTNFSGSKRKTVCHHARKCKTAQKCNEEGVEMSDLPKPRDEKTSICPKTITSLRNFNIEHHTLLKTTQYFDDLQEKLEKVMKSRKELCDLDRVMPSPQLLTSVHWKKALFLVESLQKFLKRIDSYFTDAPSYPMRFVEISKEICCDHALPSPAEKQTRKMLLMLINTGHTRNCCIRRRSGDTIINDKTSQAEMVSWMDQRLSQRPPPTATDFQSFINLFYNCQISLRSCHLWLAKLGSRYRSANSLEIYDDGHAQSQWILRQSSRC